MPRTTDAAGRLLSRDYRTRANSPSGMIADSDSFSYDATSKLRSAVSGRYSNTVTLVYDAAGRKASESLTISGRTYTSTTQYDAAGRVSRLTYPNGGRITRTYTARGQLATIVTGSTVYDTRLYDNGGRLISSSYNNGVSETRSYNDDNTLASISYSGAAIGDLGYSWDANKNKTSESIGGVMSGYGFTAGYDAEDRLTSWDRTDASLDQSWDLSPVGDWNSITENTAVQNRTHGPVHEILTAGGQAVQHDAKGNMTQIPSSLRPTASPLALKWDFDNKLKAADTDDDGTDDVFYRWDALGRRVGRDDGSSHVIYFQDGHQTLADYPAGGAASSPAYTYVYGSYIDEVILRNEGGGTRYYHRNQQYSIIALTDVGGAVVERYAYTAYGQVTFANASGTVQTASASNNRYTYTGREWDAGLGLYHFRARMYDPVAGRFISRDPLEYVDDTSMYRNYFILSATDPLGLQTTRPNGFNPEWLGSSGCIDYCRAAGIPSRDCYEYCDYNSLPEDWPRIPARPEWPVAWGTDVPYTPNVDTFPGSVNANPDDGSGPCKCVFPADSRMTPSNIERPNDGPGTTPTPGLGDMPCTPGQTRVMRYQGRCIKQDRNAGLPPPENDCECFESQGCIVYIQWKCRFNPANPNSRSNWVRVLNGTSMTRCTDSPTDGWQPPR